ncbi:MAG: hypothetical protein ACI9GO_000563 [Bacteroidia bacterium]
MKKILGYLKDFYDDHFSWGEFIVALVFVAFFCVFRYVNYIPYNDSEHSLLTSWWHTAFFAEYTFSFHFALYFLPLLFGYFMSSVFHHEWHFWKNPKFWFLILFAGGLFAFRSTLTYYINDYLTANVAYEHLDWLRSIVGTIIRGGFLFIAIWAYWYFTDKKEQPFYGFTLKNFNTRPYFIMLLIMVPLIAAASTQADFLSSYPRVQKMLSLDFTNSEHWKHFALYEVLYGLDFFSIEFFFRGFLILAFVGIVGPKAILPMAYMYVVIHWNKPMGELISSFFGGTLLGIVAYYSRSIVGGIIVHVGIAWMMEIGAFISKYFYP